MALQTSRLLPFLDEQGVSYKLIHHKLDFSAQRAAADTHTPGKEFAKTVVLDVGGRHALAVLPAHHKIDFGKAREAFGTEVTLAGEETIGELFPDCEIGAEPPFGNLYNLPVYVTPELARDELITFNAGTHHEAIRMRYGDFAKLVEPQVKDIAWHP